MEANNGYEYRIVKVRTVRRRADRATERAIERAATEGWEVVSTSSIEGLLTIPVLTLRRSIAR